MFKIFRKEKIWQENEYFDEIWKERIEKLISYVDNEDYQLCDIGCGEQWTKEFLPENIKYIPVDYTKRTFDTIVCDLNKKELPSTDIMKNVVLCSGVLEYIVDLDWFVSSLKNTDKVITSYCILERFPSIKIRNRYSWKNNLTLEELITLFIKNGFVLSELDIVNNNHVFCFLKK